MARGPALLEAVAVGAGSAVLGGLVLSPFGIAPVGAVIAGANGVISGWRGVYEWRRAPGWVAAAVDATWGLVGVTGALAVHALSFVRGDPGYVGAMSRRKNRHVYRGGFSPRRKFAFTAGNTITNAGDIHRERRRMLIERHEGLHVWQQRWFGPLFPLLYGGWLVGGAISGSIVHATRRGSSWPVVVERHAYYYNPFERWAYVADHNWPPQRMVRLMASERAAAR